MTQALFRDDPYMKTARGRVTGHTSEGGVILDQTLFYATAGGQPGDSGKLVWPGGEVEVATAVKAKDTDDLILVPATPSPLPPIGTEVEQRLDWVRRHRHMRMHTALHLLSVIIPLPVTGGAIGADRGRLDFAMPEPTYEKDFLTARLSQYIADDLKVTEEWITEEELAANPELVKTLSVQPPKGAGKVRLVRIAGPKSTVDLQPCGGTHVARTSEIGTIRAVKIENKGRQNRRVVLAFEGT